MVAEQGPQLVMPLLRLAPTGPDVTGRIDGSPAPRTLHLDDKPDAGLLAWVARVRTAAEPCLLLDADGRVAALSPACGSLLMLDTTAVVGVLLLDLVVMVDFTAAAQPIADADLQAPPLRALLGGGLARGLVRLRRGDQLTTFDVVGVPLADGAGALGFVSQV